MPQWRKSYRKMLEDQAVDEMPNDFTRLFWICLPLELDREGRGLDNPAWIKSHYFPLRRDVSLKKVEAAMAWLAGHGLIERYQVNGRGYFWQPCFAEEQGDTSREAPSLYPAPPAPAPVEAGPAPAPVEPIAAGSSVTPDLLTTSSRPAQAPDSDTESDADTDVLADAAPNGAARHPGDTLAGKNGSAGRLLDTFLAETHLDLPRRKNVRAFWSASLAEIYELAGRDEDAGRQLIGRAVAQLRADGCTIGGPESLVKTCRALAAGQPLGRAAPAVPDGPLLSAEEQRRLLALRAEAGEDNNGRH